MKRKLSVFSMTARGSFGKLCLIFLAMALLNVGLLLLHGADGSPRLWAILGKDAYLHVFNLGLLLTAWLLAFRFRDRGGHQNYFFDRLCISRKALYFEQSAYHILCFLMLWLWETVSLLLVYLLARGLYPGAYTGQSLMFACYRSPVLNLFLPLGNWQGWISSLLMILCLGFSTAALPAKHRMGKTAVSTYLTLAAALVMVMVQGQGDLYNAGNRLIYCALAVVSTGIAMGGALGEEEEHG